MSGPYGEFRPVYDSKKEMIWVGGGAGMAPLRAQIMHMLKTRNCRDREMHYFYGARAIDEVFFLDDFLALEKEFPNFHFHLALDRPDPKADQLGIKYTPGFIAPVMGDTYLKQRMTQTFVSITSEVNMRTEQELQGVTLLGNQHVQYSDQYNPGVLETFENKHPENEYLVTFDCPEFTTLCPKTGQPDFGHLFISYIPRERMVESKSLKLYLFSFRNHGDFHEDCVNIIMKDLVKLMDPKYLEVTGWFMPRGGISIYPFANYADKEHEALKEQRLREQFSKVYER